jgi:hypothetical protein
MLKCLEGVFLCQGPRMAHFISPSALLCAMHVAGHIGRHQPWIKRLVSYLSSVYTQNCCGGRGGGYRRFLPLYIFSSTFLSTPILSLPSYSLDLSRHINGKNAVATWRGGNDDGLDVQSATRLEGCCQMSAWGWWKGGGFLIFRGFSHWCWYAWRGR